MSVVPACPIPGFDEDRVLPQVKHLGGIDRRVLAALDKLLRSRRLAAAN